MVVLFFRGVSIGILLLISACDSQLSDSGGGESKDFIGNKKPNVSCESPVILQPTYDRDVILASGCYQANSIVRITDNAQFIIEPNTIILFNTQAGISADGGNLIAEGTPDEPIFFTGLSKTPGSWGGLRIFRRNELPHVITNSVIEFAGNSTFVLNESASFSVDHDKLGANTNKGRITFNNNVIRDSAGKYAFYADRFSFFASIENNIIYRNTNAPVYMMTNEAHLFGTTNQLSYNGEDNGVNKFTIGGDKLESTNAQEAFNVSQVSWNKHEVPYVIEEDIKIYNTTLSIEAGVELQFEAEAGLTITNNSIMSAIGTEDKPIRFTSTNASQFSPQAIIDQDTLRGSWRGIQYLGTDSTQNKLSYVTIEYGGELDNIYQANLIITDGARVRVSDSILRLSGDFGFYIDDKSFLEFQSNLIHRNVHPGRASVKALRFLDTETNYSGNDDGSNYIDVIKLANSQPLNTADIWPAINVPYAFKNDYSIFNSLSIEAGAVLLFDEGIELIIDGEESSLTIEGGEENPVKMSSLSILDQDAPVKFWSGILFRNSPGSGGKNRLEHVSIDYAGYTKNGQISDGTTAGIRVMSPDRGVALQSNLSVDYLTMQSMDNNSWGIYVDEHSSLFQRARENNFVPDGICEEPDRC